MSLLLQNVPPSQGLQWMRQGFRLFGRHPLAFSLMLVSFMFGALVVSIVPMLGSLVMLAALPLLSLGFMIASASALRSGPIHPGQFIQPFKTDASRRKSLAMLCVAYGAATLLVMLLSDTVDGGRFQRLQQLLGHGQATAELESLLQDPALSWGMAVRFGLIALFSIPFWHAPALVHWGGQSPAQALFSSTLAVWRCKGAFVVYTLSWVLMVAGFAVFTALLSSLLSVRGLAGVLLLPSVLIFSTVFYVSLWFTFQDSFGTRPGSEVPAPESLPPAPQDGR
jgi:hypothetical protein